MKAILSTILLFCCLIGFAGDTLYRTEYHPRKGKKRHSIVLKYDHTKALSAREDSILAIAKSYVGKKVCFGYCQQYIHQVIADYNKLSYGSMRKRKSKYINRIKIKNLRPGDIMEYDSVTLQSGKVYPAHSMLVYKIERGVIHILHQGERHPVFFDTIDIFDPFTEYEKIIFYRIRK